MQQKPTQPSLFDESQSKDISQARDKVTTNHKHKKPENNTWIVIHTDGACKGNPGIGAWAATIRYTESHIEEIAGVVEYTTNNQMELLAVINALKTLPPNSCAQIFTDSQYVQKGMTEWITGWKARNWKNVKNVDLWQQLDSIAFNLQLQWKWVKGHDIDTQNNYVDKLANEAIKNHLLSNGS